MFELSTGVLVGLLALQEALPSGAAARTLQLLAWLLILFGVTGLALGPGGAPPMITRVCLLLRCYDFIIRVSCAIVRVFF